MKHDLPFHDLDEEFEKWYGHLGPDETVTIEEWITDAGSLRALAGYARLFWPEFVEHDDCVLRAGFSKTFYEGTLAQANGDKTAVEALLNHKHIASIFGYSFDEASGRSETSPSRELVVYVGRLLKDIWQKKLKCDFPDRHIKVDFIEGGCDSIIDYQITFYQERKAQ